MTVPAGPLAGTIATLKARTPAPVIICHVRTGAVHLTQDPDARRFPGFEASPPNRPDAPAANSVIGWSTPAGEAERFLDIRDSSRAQFENLIWKRLDLAKQIVTGLKNQGVRLALDDFGTGFSSLAHLRSLPFDVIKIDRSFVSTLEDDRESAAIVRAVTTLADAIGVPVTVEGIEDAATHAAVAGFGCAVGQGWYFGKPMSGDQAAALLRSREPNAPGATASGRRTA